MIRVRSKARDEARNLRWKRKHELKNCLDGFEQSMRATREPLNSVVFGKRERR
jgi:hypothetical protein